MYSLVMPILLGDVGREREPDDRRHGRLPDPLARLELAHDVGANAHRCDSVRVICQPLRRTAGF